MENLCLKSQELYGWMILQVKHDDWLLIEL